MQGTGPYTLSCMLFSLTVKVVRLVQCLGHWNCEIVTESLDKQKAKAGGSRSVIVSQQTVDFVVASF